MRSIAILALLTVACGSSDPPASSPRAAAPSPPSSSSSAPVEETAKSRTIKVLNDYKPTVNEAPTMEVLSAIVEKRLFLGDDDVGRVLIATLQKVKYSHGPSGQVGVAIGDALAVVCAPATREPLLAIVREPNDGAETIINKQRSGGQAVAAQALGAVGDKSSVAPMIDAMFEHASRQTQWKDPTTGEDVTQASRLTTAVSMILSAALARLGDVAVDPLLPYLRNDETDPAVVAVRKKFADYVSQAGSKAPLTFVNIASTTLEIIGTKRVTRAVAAQFVRPTLSPEERKSMLGLLVALPSDAETLAAFKTGYELSSPKLKSDAAASASRFMRPELTSWLVSISGGTDADLRISALTSAIWLASPKDLPAVEAAFKKAKMLETRDPLWRTVEPTTKTCNPKVKSKEPCEEDPEKPGKYVLYKDLTPTYGEELAIVKAQLASCGEKGKCYLDAFFDGVRIIDKSDLSKITAEWTRAGIAMQKAAWMLAVHATDDEMIALVDKIPALTSPAARSYVQMALSARFPDGSVRVADAIDAMVKRERAEKHATANREASQFEPIARKLRTRARG